MNGVCADISGTAMERRWGEHTNKGGEEATYFRIWKTLGGKIRGPKEGGSTGSSSNFHVRRSFKQAWERGKGNSHSLKQFSVRREAGGGQPGNTKKKMRMNRAV